MNQEQIDAFLADYKLPDEIAAKITKGNAVRARGGQEVVDAIADDHAGDMMGVVDRPRAEKRRREIAQGTGVVASSASRPGRLTVAEKNANEAAHQARARRDRYGY